MAVSSNLLPILLHLPMVVSSTSNILPSSNGCFFQLSNNLPIFLHLSTAVFFQYSSTFQWLFLPISQYLIKSRHNRLFPMTFYCISATATCIYTTNNHNLKKKKKNQCDDHRRKGKAQVEMETKTQVETKQSHLKRYFCWPKTSAQCPCGEADQTPEHYLQSCSLHQQARQQIWPTCVSLKTKLWGSAEDLFLTSKYVALTGERI